MRLTPRLSEQYNRQIGAAEAVDQTILNVFYVTNSAGMVAAEIVAGEWERRRGLRLRFIYRRSGPSLFVAEGRLNTRRLGVASRSKTGRSLTTVAIFLLVRSVKLRKHLDLNRAAKAAQDGIPGAIVANSVETRR